MVHLQDRRVEAAPVLHHRQVDAILMDILPLHGEGLRLPEPREQEKLKEHLVDRVLQIVDRATLGWEVFDDQTLWLFLVPLDRHRRRLG